MEEVLKSSGFNLSSPPNYSSWNNEAGCSLQTMLIIAQLLMSKKLNSCGFVDIILLETLVPTTALKRESLSFPTNVEFFNLCKLVIYKGI